MRRWLITIVLSVFTVASITPVFFLATPKRVTAQVAAVPTSEVPLSPLSSSAYTTAVNTGLTNGLIGLPGTTQTIMTTIRESLGEACTVILKQLDSGQTLQSLVETTTTSALSSLGGSDVEAGKLAEKIVRVATAKECIDNYLLALSKFSPPSVLVGQDLQREQDKFTKITESLRKMVEDLQARHNASVKDIMRAFMVKLILNLNKNLTTNLVNNLINKYKISDYLAYSDALATQVYAMKYIDQNYTGDARTQMMMRSLIQSQKAPEQARIAAHFANQQAKEYLAKSCDGVGSLDAYNASSLNCLAAYGNVESSPMFKYMNALDTAQQIQAVANKTAQAEISQSNGYAPPRDCSGSVSQQKELDAKIKAVSKEKDAAEAVLAQLKQALAKGQTTQSEVAKAEAAVVAAETKLANLPTEVPSPIVVMCKAIDSPASFIDRSIETFIKQHIDQASQLKSDNLPFYANFLSNVASNFLTNLLTGGNSKSQVFKEAGLEALSAGVVSLGSLANNQKSGSGSITPQSLSEDDVQIYARTANSTERTNVLMSGQSYVLVIDFKGLLAQPGTSKDPLFNPVRAVVSGGNFEGSNNILLSPADLAAGRIEFDLTNVTRSFSINVQFYARVQGSDTPLRNGGWTQSFVVGTVGGAKTVFFNPRGDMPNTHSFRIR